MGGWPCPAVPGVEFPGNVGGRRNGPDLGGGFPFFLSLFSSFIRQFTSQALRMAFRVNSFLLPWHSDPPVFCSSVIAHLRPVGRRSRAMQTSLPSHTCCDAAMQRDSLVVFRRGTGANGAKAKKWVVLGLLLCPERTQKSSQDALAPWSTWRENAENARLGVNSRPFSSLWERHDNGAMSQGEARGGG